MNRFKTIFEEHEEWDPSKSLGSKTEFGSPGRMLVYHPGIDLKYPERTKRTIRQGIDEFNRHFGIDFNNYFNIVNTTIDFNHAYLELSPVDTDSVDWWRAHAEYDRGSTLVVHYSSEVGDFYISIHPGDDWYEG
jgi:hypothetical protein